MYIHFWMCQAYWIFLNSISARLCESNITGMKPQLQFDFEIQRH
ncbi:hypothetical protein D915_008122 [Fasciola hepatica]|uniref:Uncharacterized protein n=1 Tax=Fasciola hepatica TaxID=6192 RepID=A0A4E0QZI4_FASHE|nr:hypothetical protein D915_008122 [Fasciola hepatica]